MTWALLIEEMKEDLNNVMYASSLLKDQLPDDLAQNIVQLRKYMLNGLQTLNNLESKIDVGMGVTEVKK